LLRVLIKRHEEFDIVLLFRMGYGAKALDYEDGRYEVVRETLA
jgi:hypothetical protein